MALDLISHNQSAFVKGHLIEENYMPVEEMVQGFRHKSIPRRACVSIDLTKSFDSLSWLVVCRMLLVNGFFRPIINLVYRCISSAIFSIIIVETVFYLLWS